MSMRKYTLQSAALCSLLLASSSAAAQGDAKATTVSISLSKEGDPELGEDLVAKVSGKEGPIEGVMITFATPRLFGMLPIGEAETDSEGLATIPFPSDLPGDAKTGHLTVHAKVYESTTYAGEATTTLAGGRPLKIEADPFPREIWSPNTERHLLTTIPLLIAAVWSVYIFALRQLVKLSRTRKEVVHSSPTALSKHA